MNLEELVINSSFLDEIGQPIFIKNTNGVYVYCNKAFSDFVAIPREKIINRTDYDIAPRSLANIYTKADNDLLHSTQKQECLVKVLIEEKSEIKVIFKKSVLYDPERQLSGFIGMVQTHSELIKQPVAELNRLTEREVDALNLLAQGKSIKAIAKILMISPHTVADHLKSIYLKLGVHSKNEAIYKALPFLTSQAQ